MVVGYIGDSKEHYSERLLGKHIYSTRENLTEVIRKRNIQAVLVSPMKNGVFMKNPKFQDLLIDAGVKIYIAQNAEEWNKL